MKSTRSSKHAVLAALLLVPALATGAVLSHRGAIEQSLGAVERLPSRERLDSLSEEQSFTYLRIIVEDKSAPAKVRLSALSALADYPGEETESFLRRAIDSFAGAKSGTHSLFARAAMRSLATLARNAEAPDRAAPTLVAYLDHPSPDMRAEVAECLLLAGARGALNDLRDALHVETSPVVKQALDDAIVSLTLRPAP
jgi:hypothetical protein